MTQKFRYNIYSGWWCDSAEENLPHHRGDRFIRSERFHRLWYRSICQFTKPARIVIVDSNSPVKPPLADDDKRLHMLSLAKNAGHATRSSDKFCGWTASVLVGLMDCLLSDAEYFVYVEQDVLLMGEGIVEFAIQQMSGPYMFGDATGIPNPIQQSFFIVSKGGVEPFLRGLLAIPQADSILSPERKFRLAATGSSWLSLRWAQQWLRAKIHWIKPYSHLPFGQGRIRPVLWSQPHFYFQHGSVDEIENYGTEWSRRYGENPVHALSQKN